MEIRTYRASSMQDALAMVRRDLGPAASVLHTREVGSRLPWRWMMGRRQIEVTASNDVNVPSRFVAKTQEENAAGNPAPSPARPQRADAPHASPPSPRFATPPDPEDRAGWTTDSATQPPHELHDQIGELQSMVEQLYKRHNAGGRREELPQQAFELYTDLIDADLSEELAREFVDRVRTEANGHVLADPMRAKACVARMIENEIHVTGPIRPSVGRRHLVALVGPTGVGKTTTIAKLAANYRLREKRRVGLITVDTYRIAAVEQLRTYADIIDLPMHVVSTPHEMREAVEKCADLDLVLMDTAGRSPRDEVKIHELKCFLGEAQADEVHLVLSSVAGASSLKRTADEFAAVGTSAIILTKLDEAAGLGNLLPLVRSSRLPLSYLTNGQNVPDDIEAADAAKLAQIILGSQS